MNWFLSSPDFNTNVNPYDEPEERTYIYDGEAEPVDELAVIAI